MRSSRSVLPPSALRAAIPGVLLCLGVVWAVAAVLSRPAPAACWSRAANGVSVANACAVRTTNPCSYNVCVTQNINCNCDPDDPDQPNAGVRSVIVSNPPQSWRACVSNNFGPGATCGMDYVPCGTTVSYTDYYCSITYLCKSACQARACGAMAGSWTGCDP